MSQNSSSSIVPDVTEDSTEERVESEDGSQKDFFQPYTTKIITPDNELSPYIPVSASEFESAPFVPTKNDFLDIASSPSNKNRFGLQRSYTNASNMSGDVSQERLLVGEDNRSYLRYNTRDYWDDEAVSNYSNPKLFPFERREFNRKEYFKQQSNVSHASILDDESAMPRKIASAMSFTTESSASGIRRPVASKKADGNTFGDGPTYETIGSPYDRQHSAMLSDEPVYVKGTFLSFGGTAEKRRAFRKCQTAPCFADENEAPLTTTFEGDEDQDIIERYEMEPLKSVTEKNVYLSHTRSPPVEDWSCQPITAVDYFRRSSSYRPFADDIQFQKQDQIQNSQYDPGMEYDQARQYQEFLYHQQKQFQQFQLFQQQQALQNQMNHPKVKANARKSPHQGQQQQLKANNNPNPAGNAAKGQNKQKKKNAQMKYLCTYIIGIPNEEVFGVKKRILGAGGRNMKAITTRYEGAKLRLRGIGSGFNEWDTGEESTEPLQLNLSVPDSRSYLGLRNDVEVLLKRLYRDYQRMCNENVSLQCHEHPQNPKIRTSLHQDKNGSRKTKGTNLTVASSTNGEDV